MVISQMREFKTATRWWRRLSEKTRQNFMAEYEGSCRQDVLVTILQRSAKCSPDVVKQLLQHIDALYALYPQKTLPSPKGAQQRRDKENQKEQEESLEEETIEIHFSGEPKISAQQKELWEVQKHLDSIKIETTPDEAIELSQDGFKIDLGELTHVGQKVYVRDLDNQMPYDSEYVTPENTVIAELVEKNRILNVVLIFEGNPQIPEGRKDIKLQTRTPDIEVIASVKDLTVPKVDVIVDLARLTDLGDTLHVKDLSLPSWAKLQTDPDEVVAFLETSETENRNGQESAVSPSPQEKGTPTTAAETGGTEETPSEEEIVPIPVGTDTSIERKQIPQGGEEQVEEEGETNPKKKVNLNLLDDILSAEVAQQAITQRGEDNQREGRGSNQGRQQSSTQSIHRRYNQLRQSFNRTSGRSFGNTVERRAFQQGAKGAETIGKRLLVEGAKAATRQVTVALAAVSAEVWIIILIIFLIIMILLLIIVTLIGGESAQAKGQQYERITCSDPIPTDTTDNIETYVKNTYHVTLSTNNPVTGQADLTKSFVQRVAQDICTIFGHTNNRTGYAGYDQFAKYFLYGSLTSQTYLRDPAQMVFSVEFSQTATPTCQVSNNPGSTTTIHILDPQTCSQDKPYMLEYLLGQNMAEIALPSIKNDPNGLKLINNFTTTIFKNGANILPGPECATLKTSDACFATMVGAYFSFIPMNVATTTP